MPPRIIEIAQDNRHLAADRGFMVVSEEKAEIGRIPLDDIAAIVTHAHGLTYSNNLLTALAKRQIPFVLCDASHSPVAILWAVDGHHLQGGRIQAQLEATRPMTKRLWQEVVRAKISQQASVLHLLGKVAPLLPLVGKVRSGDPDNIEAQAARRYFPALFGRDFQRDRSLPGINGLLNYGYTVLRAATARAIMAAGLHPSLGIHHRNSFNAMPLADDLMEPFRPVVDWEVYRLCREGISEVTPDARKRLALLMYHDLKTDQGTSPLFHCLHQLTLSLAQNYLGERQGLALPEPFGANPGWQAELTYDEARLE